MLNKTVDTQALHDCMDDFSNMYGDQDLLDAMRLWLEKKMGGTWRIVMSDSSLDRKLGRADLTVELLKKLNEYTDNHTLTTEQKQTLSWINQLLAKEVKVL